MVETSLLSTATLQRPFEISKNAEYSEGLRPSLDLLNKALKTRALCSYEETMPSILRVEIFLFTSIGRNRQLAIQTQHRGIGTLAKWSKHLNALLNSAGSCNKTFEIPTVGLPEESNLTNSILTNQGSCDENAQTHHHWYCRDTLFLFLTVVTVTVVFLIDIIYHFNRKIELIQKMH